MLSKLAEITGAARMELERPCPRGFIIMAGADLAIRASDGGSAQPEILADEGNFGRFLLPSFPSDTSHLDKRFQYAAPVSLGSKELRAAVLHWLESGLEIRAENRRNWMCLS